MRLPAAALFVSIFLSAFPARSQGADSGGADALFRHGMTELNAGRLDTACPAFAESYRLEPLLGTLFTLAECEVRANKLASAMARYNDYAERFSRLSGPDRALQRGREKRVEAQRAALEGRVPVLTLTLARGAPEGAIVRRDRVTIGAAQLGVGMPVDPGEHVVQVEAPGRPVVEERVTLAAGEKRTLELKLPVEKTAIAASTPPVPGEAFARPVGPTPAGPGKRRTMAYVAGGVGITGVVVGSVAGLLTMMKKKTVDERCAGLQCDRQGLDAANAMKTDGLISTIGFAVAAVGLGAGAGLLLTEPHESRSASRFLPVLSAGGHGATAGLRGGF